MTFTTPVLDFNRTVDTDPVSIAHRLRRAFERLQEDREEAIDEVVLLLKDAVLDLELAISA
jgi:hypothetical protein